MRLVMSDPDETNRNRSSKNLSRYWLLISLTIGVILAAVFMVSITIYVDFLGPTISAETANQVTAAETRSIAFWTWIEALSGIAAGLATAAAATFAALAFRETRLAREAAVRQADTAHKQYEADQRRFARSRAREMNAANVRKGEIADERRRRLAEQDERAAANRAILILRHCILRRGSSGHHPTWSVSLSVGNVGGSVALEVGCGFKIVFEFEGEKIAVESPWANPIPIETSGKDWIETQTYVDDFEVKLDVDKRREIINHLLDAHVEIDVEWRDVHGYQLRNRYVADWTFADGQFVIEGNPIHTDEFVQIGDRLASHREVD